MDLKLLADQEPSWPEPAILGKSFPEKWPMAKLPKKKVMLLMLFYGKNIGLYVLMFEKQSFYFEQLGQVTTRTYRVITRT
jgi:hypothetical protein